jgi:valyl-tRNA synthetase
MFVARDGTRCLKRNHETTARTNMSNTWEVEKKIFVKASDLLNPLTPSIHEYMWENHPKVNNFKIESVSWEGVWVVWELESTPGLI